MFKTFVKQIAINESGGLRISIYKQCYSDSGELIQESPHQMVWGLFDDIDHVVEANNQHLVQMGFPTIDPQELELAHILRDAAHAHPPVKERIRIETEQEEARITAAKAEAGKQEEATTKAEAAQHAAFIEAVKSAIERHLATTLVAESDEVKSF